MECTSPPCCYSSFHLLSLGLISLIIITVGSFCVQWSRRSSAQFTWPGECLCYNQGLTEHLKFCLESLNTELCSHFKLRHSRPDLFLIKIGVIRLQRLDPPRTEGISIPYPDKVGVKAVLSHRDVKSQHLTFPLKCPCMKFWNSWWAHPWKICTWYLRSPQASADFQALRKILLYLN